MNKILKSIFPYSDFLYLLQLEEYENQRYIQRLPRFFLRRNFQKRQKLVSTSRVQSTFIISAALTIFGFFFLSIFTILLIPMWVFIANVLLNPFYSLMKTKIQKKAAKYFSEKYKGKVIAIAGSFGKTTTKHFIYDLLRYNYRTQIIPGTINTPTGVASWILKNLDQNTEVLIVEMDSYFIGEIKRICAITPPDISVLLNIGDQHLERLGNKKNLEKALLEVFEYSKKDSVWIYPKELDKVISNTKNEKIKIEIKELSNDFEINKAFAINVAQIMDIPTDIIKDTAKKFSLPDRRGNLSELHGFTIIDRSFNISFTTAKAGLEVARATAQKMKKKLIVITGGIPELGKENKNANIEYGKVLAKSESEIILLKTILHKDILQGLGDKKPILANSMNEAWEIIQKQFSPKEYIVLMQPELNDLYY